MLAIEWEAQPLMLFYSVTSGFINLHALYCYYYHTVKLVNWCSEPSQPPSITSGLNTNFTLSPSYSFRKSFYHKSYCGLFLLYFLAYFYSVGTQHNLYPTRWTISFCGPTQEPVLATANTGKNLEVFLKKCRWMDRKGRKKQGRNPWQ